MKTLFNKTEKITFQVNVSDLKINGKELGKLTLNEAKKIAARKGGVGFGKKEEVKKFLVDKFKSIQNNGVHEMIGNSVISKPKKKPIVKKTTPIPYRDTFSDRIVNLDCKKHVKIYKLSLIGLGNDEIASILGTNNGHVWNALDMYKRDHKKVSIANEIKI